MQQYYGRGQGAVVILHGGAGPMDPSSSGLKTATDELRRIAHLGHQYLSQGMTAIDVVVECLKEMELHENFNAGQGSALQADAQARLTAALMVGENQSFSGVISATYITHPSMLARHLQNESSRVLTTPGTELLARKLNLPVASCLTPKRLKRWSERALAGESFCDTVGVLVRSADGQLYAGTSTGGRGFEHPGRVSDSATVAGTYASQHAAVSATGIGEEIVDDALAARLETRVRDGLRLDAASRLCIEEARARGRSYGWIAIDRAGAYAAVHTTPTMSFVVIDSKVGELASSTRK